jgi:GNAT superfamily N-acetyltransferase
VGVFKRLRFLILFNRKGNPFLGKILNNGLLITERTFVIFRRKFYLSMNFRVALISDIPMIQFVRNAVLENRLSDPGLVSDQDVEEYIIQRGKGWVCETDGRIVAFAIVSVKDKNIWALFVQPGYDKKGIGKRLHDQMLGWYFSQANETLWLSTAPGTRAEKFYRMKGWEQTGITKSGELKFEITADRWKENQ